VVFTSSVNYSWKVFTMLVNSVLACVCFVVTFISLPLWWVGNEMKGLGFLSHFY